jgi:hypothetical protein
MDQNASALNAGLALAQYAARARIDVDEDNPVTINEFQPVNLRHRIIFRTKILHPAHPWHHARLNLTQRFYLTLLHILAGDILFPTPCLNGSSKRRTREHQKD